MNFKKACMDLDYISGVGFGEWTILWITHVHLYSSSQSKEITKKCTYHSAKNDITTSENFLDWCLVLDTELSHHNYDVIWNKKSFALFQILIFLKSWMNFYTFFDLIVLKLLTARDNFKLVGFFFSMLKKNRNY